MQNYIVLHSGWYNGNSWRGN